MKILTAETAAEYVRNYLNKIEGDDQYELNPRVEMTVMDDMDVALVTFYRCDECGCRDGDVGDQEFVVWQEGLELYGEC